MRSLHIRAYLATPLAVNNPFGFLPLDEIVVEAALRRNLGRRYAARVLSPTSRQPVTPSLTTDASSEAEREALAQLNASPGIARLSKGQRTIRETVALTRIPLDRTGAGDDWYWRASFGFSERGPVRLRSDVHVLNVPRLEWWCVGDEDKLTRLLATVQVIGVCQRHCGSVRAWRVSRSNRDWAVWRSGGLMRSVPYVQVPDDLRQRYWPARWGIRPPYRHPAYQRQVALPPVAGSSMDDAPGQPSDVLEWRDLTLHRRERTIEFSGRRRHLTPTEVEVLATLMQAQGQPVWRQVLLQRLCPPSDATGDRLASTNHSSKRLEQTLDVYVHRLRVILETDAHHPERLVTLRGWGYRLT
jgi:DNA-binding winged helix-turn-helix (wHTH) protein